MPEPASHHPVEVLAVDPVVAAAAFAPYLDQPSLLEDSEMTRGGGPAVLEPPRQIARGELAAELCQQNEDVPPGLVREREEDLVHLLERRR